MRGKSQPVYWLHEGDEVPTLYKSHRALARRLNCDAMMVFYYLSRGVNGDKERAEYLQVQRRGKPPKPVTYQGVEYVSIEEFMKVYQVGRDKARRMLGLRPVSVSPKADSPAINNRYRNKLDAIQKLAIKVRKTTE